VTLIFLLEDTPVPAVADRPTTLFSAALRRDGRALAEVLAQVGRLYQFHDRDCICCYDVSVTQCRALQLLAERGRLTLNQLAAGLYLDKSTASRVVDALERKEYVRRKAHPEDRRAVHLEITSRGKGLVDRIQDDLAIRHAGLLAEFSPEIRHAAITLLSQLADAAAQRVETVGGKCCVIDS
jgi:DNA-binding MarR family transcriptional regulator